MKRTAAFLLVALAAGWLLVARRAAPPVAANPLERVGLARPARFTIAGRVQERLDAGGYVYVRLREPRGQSRWIVTLRALATSSDEVVATVFASAPSFHSPRLGRDFTPLYFGAVAAASPATQNAPQRKDVP